MAVVVFVVGAMHLGPLVVPSGHDMEFHQRGRCLVVLQPLVITLLGNPEGPWQAIGTADLVYCA